MEKFLSQIEQRKNEQPEKIIGDAKNQKANNKFCLLAIVSFILSVFLCFLSSAMFLVALGNEGSTSFFISNAVFNNIVNMGNLLFP